MRTARRGGAFDGRSLRLNPRDRTLERAAADLTARDRLIPEGATVLVALSGGADSVALLHWLRAEAAGMARPARIDAGRPDPAPSRPAHIAAAHVNHGLRGHASDEDAAFARALAEGWDIPYFETTLADDRRVRAGVLGRTRPSEDHARRRRYDALRELATRASADVIAVAHTADDQAETVLLRLVRGAGLRGLSGMASRSRIRGCRVIRPFLDVTRAQVLDYLARHGIPHREDASNQSREFSRNYIRHEILPRLGERLNPSIREALLRNAAIFREADAYLEQEARLILAEVTIETVPGDAREVGGKIVLDARALVHYPNLLRSYIFRCALHDLDGAARDVTAAHLDVLQSLVTQSGGRSADLPNGLHARREQGRLVLRKDRKRESGAPVGNARKREPEKPDVNPTVETSVLPADLRKESPPSEP